jgi:hypothetical protein
MRTLATRTTKPRLLFFLHRWDMVDDDSPPMNAHSERFGFIWDIAMGLREVVLYWDRGNWLTLDDTMMLGPPNPRAR